ncbi:hypothetical protein NE237_008207 [Protea cynaroides]|uniref:Uncharacterized protein n=1 Tax=Protea cynaroides TaxID=273540 RepID=A0A9Q0KQJ4_9MAGN|nr:hypothetical protein NE237_008207 [Protea cynaroides]
MGKPSCCDKPNVKRGFWTAEEDAEILAYVSMYGTGNWTSGPKKAGLKQCRKGCRLRWTDYLRPDLKHDTHTSRRKRPLIAAQLPGRTDNDIKNFWNTNLRKKLHEMGINPVTHKPFSEILTDYGKIGGLRKPETKWVQEATKYSKQEIIEPIFYSEGSSSSSSSFSTAIQTTQSPPFSWGEFLIEDGSLPSDLQQQCFQGSSSLTQVHDEMLQSQLTGESNKNFIVVGGVMDYGALNIGQSIPGTVGEEATNIFGDSVI